MPKLLQHHLNPLHVMCRLMPFMAFKTARKVSVLYDKYLWKYLKQRGEICQSLK